MVDRARRHSVPGHVHGSRSPRAVRHGVAATKLAQEEFGPCGRRAPARAASRTRVSARDGDPRRDRPAPRRGHRDAREHLQSRARRDRRRVRGRAATSCSTRRARSCAARRSPERASGSAIVRAELGTAAGLIGAGLVAFDARRVSGARGLRDADRKPRRRHAARPRRSCATADVVLCEDTRHTRVLLERHGISGAAAVVPRAQRGEADAPSCCRGCEAGERMALVSDAGMPGISDPGCATRGCRARRGRARDRPPGRVGGRDRARRERLRRPSGTSSSASCRAVRGRCASLWEELACLALSGRRLRVAAAACRRPCARSQTRSLSARSRCAAS